jgi:hypothetical protein
MHRSYIISPNFVSECQFSHEPRVEIPEPTEPNSLNESTSRTQVELTLDKAIRTSICSPSLPSAYLAERDMS